MDESLIPSLFIAAQFGHCPLPFSHRDDFSNLVLSCVWRTMAISASFINSIEKVISSSSLHAFRARIRIWTRVEAGTQWNHIPCQVQLVTGQVSFCVSGQFSRTLPTVQDRFEYVWFTEAGVECITR